MATSTAAQPSPRSESNWWLVVAGALVVHVFVYVAFAAFFAFAVLGFVSGAVLDAPAPGMLFGAGGFVVLMGAMLVMLLVGLALPVALYLDAEAVGDVAPDWDPDPVLYALVAVVGLFTQGIPVQPAVAAYYLYQRHRYVGTP